MLSKTLGNNLYPLVVLLFRSSFGLILVGLFFRVAYSLLQVAAIWIVIHWVNGSLPGVLIEAISLGQGSMMFPIACSFFLILSAGASLLSKALAIGAVKNFEKKVCNDAVKISFGDYRNVAKLLLSVVDAIIPVLLVIVVVILWSLEYSWLLAVAFLFFLAGVWLLKKGVSYASPFYAIKPNKDKGSYLYSSERIRFYKILMVPQYISMVASIGISLALVASAIASKLYVDLSSGFHSLLIIATIVSCLQVRSFVGLMVKMGAYNKSATYVNELLKASE